MSYLSSGKVTGFVTSSVWLPVGAYNYKYDWLKQYHIFQTIEHTWMYEAWAKFYKKKKVIHTPYLNMHNTWQHHVWLESKAYLSLPKN